jgi:phage terminase large subunit GpA-like protein
MLKEYPGGSLALVSAQSASQLRMASKRILIRDEIDASPLELRNNEGNWLDVSYKRTTAFTSRRKILDLSTPVGYDQSSIQKLYEEGDQCHFQIPCLKCGTFQEITFSKLVPIYDNNTELKEIYYPCESCGQRHYNQDKVKFNKLGKWVPTAVSKSETMKSVYLSGLYSPPGMLSWEEMRREYDAAQQDDSGEKMKTFVTLSLGKAYRDITTKPKLQSVTRLRNNYKERTIPPGVLYLTVGIDVQTGEKDPRLELEVLGVGDQWRTWSIDYRVVNGEVKDPTGGAWSALVQGVTRDNWFSFKRADGVKFEPMMIFIDTGDGNVSDVIYKFIDGYQWKKTHAIKGFGTIRTTTHKMIRYRPHASGRFVEINTNHYKKTIYRNLENSYRSFNQSDDIQDIGFCHFPAEYSEKYFEMLTAEDARADGTFYCPHGKRNEALDARVYALCASDFFLDNYVKKLQADLRTKGFPENKILEREHKFVLRHFATTTGQVYPYRPEDLAEYLASKKRPS